ncbi:hypothetical protein LTR08_002650 [Meristemomyces frigidus]|nr:hypothetical protein LTR08_002650 [Meristemomyces frigidus]
MASKPDETHDLGLGISGAEEPTNNTHEPEQPQQVELDPPTREDADLDVHRDADNNDVPSAHDTDQGNADEEHNSSDQPSDKLDTGEIPETNSRERVNVVSRFSPDSSDEEEDAEEDAEDDARAIVAKHGSYLGKDDWNAKMESYLSSKPANNESDSSSNDLEQQEQQSAVNQESDESQESHGKQELQQAPEEQLPWNAMIAEEEARHYLYQHRPRRYFSVHGPADDLEFSYPLRTHASWGRNGERYWVNGEPKYPRPNFQHKYKRNKQQKPDKVPSRLRKSKIVNDISPETSPKQASDPFTPYIPAGPRRWMDDDEDQDYGVIQDYIESYSRPSSRCSNRDDAEGAEDAEDAEDLPTVSAINEDVNDASALGDVVPTQPRLDESSEAEKTPSAEAASEEPLGPSIPALDTTVADEQPPRRDDAPEDTLGEDNGDTRPSPQDVGSLVNDANVEDPSSPTPSNASSVESTTGMTHSQGLEAMRKYFEEEQRDLTKMRSRLKDNDGSDAAVAAIAEDPKDRIELLVTKVHQYRQARNEARDRVNRAEAYIEELLNELRKVRRETGYELQELQKRAGGYMDRMFAEKTKFQEDNDDLEERLEKAKAEEAAARKAYKQELASRKKAEQSLGGWKTYAESNRELAELQRRRQEDEAETNTYVLTLPFASYYTGHIADLFDSAGSDHDDISGPPAHSTQQGTQPDRASGPTYVDRGTEPGVGYELPRPHTADFAVPGKYRIERLPTAIMGLEEIRWPAETRTDVASHIAKWINEKHNLEVGRKNDPPPPVDQLTAAKVEQCLGKGKTSFDQLIEILQRAGYIFRPDHFALDVEEYTRGIGPTNLEAMEYYRRFGWHRDNPVRGLLEEVEKVRRQRNPDQMPWNRDSEVVNMRNSLLSANCDIEDYVKDLKRAREELEECHAHGSQLTNENAELEDTIKQLIENTESGKSSASSSPEIGRGETSNLERQLAACRSRGAELQTTIHALEATIHVLKASKVKVEEDAEARLNESEVSVATTLTANEALTTDLKTCHEHGEQLKGLVAKLKSEKEALQLAKDQLNADVSDYTTRLSALEEDKRKFEDLVQAQADGGHAADQSQEGDVRAQLATLQRKEETHINMLQAAKDHIDNLNAEAQKLAAQDGKLRDRIAQLEAVVRTQPARPLPLFITPAEPQRQPQSGVPPTPSPLPMPRSPGVAALSSTPASPTLPASSRPAHWVEREARIRSSEAYKQNREVLRQKRQAEEEKQAELNALRQRAHKKLCGWDEVPYVPEEERWESLRRLDA